MPNYTFVTPTINNRLLSTWGAELLNYEVGPCSFSNGWFKAPNSIFPVSLKPSIGLRQITLVMDFTADTPLQLAKNISDMTNVLQDSPDILLPDGFLYMCEYDSATAPVRKAPWIEQVKFRLYGVRHGEPEYGHFTQPLNYIYVLGNIETPMYAELFYNGYEESITFYGITIDMTNLPSTVTSVIIDGFHKTIKDMRGNNFFGRTNMTKWPTLMPGNNQVRMGGLIQAEVTYYPLWK